jgi:hypothetical protein
MQQLKGTTNIGHKKKNNASKRGVSFALFCMMQKYWKHKIKPLIGISLKRDKENFYNVLYYYESRVVWLDLTVQNIFLKHGSIVVYLEVVHEYNGIFIIVFDASSACLLLNPRRLYPLIAVVVIVDHLIILFFS